MAIERPNQVWCADITFIPVKRGLTKKEHDNPAKGIPLFKQQSDGWEPWPDDVRDEFEWLATPRARLVYELCLGTGQRIGPVLTA